MQQVSSVVNTKSAQGIVMQQHQQYIADMRSKVSSAPHAAGSKVFKALDSKALSNMETFKDDKASFRAWHDKFVNVFTQVMKGSRVVPDAITSHVDQEAGE